MILNTEVKNSYLLSTLFSSSFISKLTSRDISSHLSGILNQTNFHHKIAEHNSVKQILSKAYNYLSRNYRCEYIFKTAILNEILLKRHDLKNAIYLTEFRAFNSKADIVILNGTSSVYEIKSDIDNLDRLKQQVSAYQKVFDRVFVVCNENNRKKVRQIIPTSVGILILNADLTIETVRESGSNLKKLDKAFMFDTLRKPEYLSIINEAFGKTPDLPGTKIHTYCKKLFSQLKNKEAHNLYVKTLRNRQLSSKQIQLIKSSPLSLKCLFTEKHYSEKECDLIRIGLNQKLPPLKN